MLTRKTFIKHTATLGAGFFVTQYVGAKPYKRKQHELTLFHTNDIHSRIDPFPSNHKRYGGKGGLLALSAAYQKQKKQVEHSLLLDCGDIFQGTPYFNFFKGQVEYETMSAMGFDASTLGNHDFDNGIEGLTKTEQYRKFDILNSNYDFRETDLTDRVKTYKVLEVGGMTIGLFGLGIQLKGLVPSENHAGIVYHDPIIKASEMAQYLKLKHKCNLVVCLSHLGYVYGDQRVSDQILAKSSKNIDVILGGHTHTFLDKPVKFQNAKKKNIIVNQAGWSALKLGRVDLVIK